MSTHNICFREEIRKISIFRMKKAPYLLLCGHCSNGSLISVVINSELLTTGTCR